MHKYVCMYMDNYSKQFFITLCSMYMTEKWMLHSSRLLLGVAFVDSKG